MIKNFSRNEIIAILCLILITSSLSLAWIRLKKIGFDFSLLTPEKVYDVEVMQIVQGGDEPVELKTFLPMEDERQNILSENNNSGLFHFISSIEGDNRIAVWKAENLSSKSLASVNYRVSLRPLKFMISDEFKLGFKVPQHLHHYLEPTEVIQSQNPEILKLSKSLIPQDNNLLAFLKESFSVVNQLAVRPFKGTTSALTALRLKEASCNGKSRLLVALWRSQGIPARLVGGMILTKGVKRTSHQWVEAWIGDRWIPFDPTNHHFAQIPENYLVLYRGDFSLFTHTRDILFKYHFRIDSDLIPRHELTEKNQVLGIWTVFSELGIPLDLLKIIIMLPLGAIVVVIFRNVVGIRTYGTFLPALIAAAAGKTGIFWGLVGFIILILIGGLIRGLLSRLQILHSPQLSIILTGIIAMMLVLALTGSKYHVPNLGRVTLFPIAILAITAERFFLISEEESPVTAIKTLFLTLFVTYFCYITMNSLALVILMLAFPEFLLIAVAVNLWLGRWVGLRITEWFRFGTLSHGDSGN